MKLEVGMYVRTKDGEIGTIYGIDEKQEDIMVDNGMFYDMATTKGFMCDKDEIKKASHSIIDLIEVGDYVNGMQVKNMMSAGTSIYVIRKDDVKYVCCGDYGEMDDGSGRSCYALQWRNEDIKETLTKEQYEREVYRVKEDL